MAGLTKAETGSALDAAIRSAEQALDRFEMLKAITAMDTHAAHIETLMRDVLGFAAEVGLLGHEANGYPAVSYYVCGDTEEHEARAAYNPIFEKYHPTDERASNGVVLFRHSEIQWLRERCDEGGTADAYGFHKARKIFVSRLAFESMSDQTKAFIHESRLASEAYWAERLEPYRHPVGDAE
jgi:hypothetical protein